METVKVIFSGITGKTGREAMKAVGNMPDVEIIAGMKRNVSGADDFHLRGELFEGVEWMSYDTGMFGIDDLVNRTKSAGANIFIDFSHSDVFSKVLELAIRAEVPLISGTSGLSNRQMESLHDATNRIPIFRGGNFRFKVKKFIDEAVKLAMVTPGNLTLYENFYEGKSLPSETSKVIQRRIYEATGKTVEVYSEANLPREGLQCCWRLDFGTKLRNDLECKTVGFDELAHDVLEIAKVMAKKPVRPGKLYDLDEIWDDLLMLGAF